MAEVQFSWGGLVLGADPFRVTSLSGWLDLPDGSWESTAAPGHGVSPSPGVRGPRIVQIGGFINAAGSAARNQAVAQLVAETVPRASWDATSDPLVGTAAGVTLTVDAQLARRSPAVELNTWSTQVVPWLLQFRCPDPRFYLPWVSATAPLTAAVTGAVLPQTMPFTMTAKPLGGQVTLVNVGNDPEGSPLLVTLTGAQSGTIGVEVTHSDGSIAVATWSGLGLSTTDTFVVDTERGGGFLNDTYRPSAAGSRIAAMRLSPGVNVVRALGTAGAGSPTITAAVRPRLW